METVPCPLCGSDRAKPLWIKQDAHYVRCVDCSLVYENPRLTEIELFEFYSQASYFVQNGHENPTSGYRDYFAQCTSEICEEYFDIVERSCDRPTGVLCDVGCGPGTLLKVAQMRGWRAVGVEVSSWAVNEGKKQGLEIYEGPLPVLGFQAEQFDAVAMFDVLEHLSSPKEYVAEIYRILKPGGVLVVETPNVDGFFVRHLYKEKADLVKPRAHICLYGPASARRLFSVADFSSVEIATFPYSRKISMGYLKQVLLSHLFRGRAPLQLTLNDSLRIVCRK
jgi:2-polyprenyl-3-methyl-5-hydroxy-6-metoxy-1,4-benzoquinol methylase